MTELEIKRAKIGDRVKFVPLDADSDAYSEGTITNVLHKAVEVTWDDGTVIAYRANNGSRVFLKKA